jgi:hypothetical protein
MKFVRKFRPKSTNKFKFGQKVATNLNSAKIRLQRGLKQLNLPTLPWRRGAMVIATA